MSEPVSARQTVDSCRPSKVMCVCMYNFWVMSGSVKQANTCGWVWSELSSWVKLRIVMFTLFVLGSSSSKSSHCCDC